MPISTKYVSGLDTLPTKRQRLIRYKVTKRIAKCENKGEIEVSLSAGEVSLNKLAFQIANPEANTVGITRYNPLIAKSYLPTTKQRIKTILTAKKQI